MNEEMEFILGEALDLLEQGESVDAILASHPAHAAELRPFLLTAVRLSALAPQPSLKAEQKSKQAFLAAAAVQPARRAAGGRLSRLLAPVLALVLILLLGGTALVSASGAAVPGDALYETKRLFENVRLGLATDPERAAALREQFRQERLAEVARLLAEGRDGEVTLTGTIEAITPATDGARWIVDGLPVWVDDDTAVDGVAGLGALVEIAGQVRDGALRATMVTVLSGGRPPTPEPESEPQPEPATPIVPGAAPPTVAPTSTPTPTITATATPTPVATMVATIAPTHTAAPPVPPDDNDNDDDDDDDDFNDNDDDDNANDSDDLNDNDNNGNDNDDDNDDNGNDDDDLNDNDDDNDGNDDENNDDNADLNDNDDDDVENEDGDDDDGGDDDEGD